MVIKRENLSTINYYFFEPSAPHLRPVISETIYLDQFFDISRIDDDSSVSFIYRDGCLVISVSDIQATGLYFLLLTLRTKKVGTISQLHYPYSYMAHNYDIFISVYTNGAHNHKTFIGVSTDPSSPDCVFLAVRYTKGYILDVSTFRHGDGDWTTTEVFSSQFGVPCNEDVVFIGRSFFFLLSRGRLGQCESGSRLLDCLDLPSEIDLQHFHKFFGLGFGLMVLYYDAKAHKFCVRRFDWEQKVWVPLQSLGNQSLFLSSRSVYVDAVNYYGVSANKIYVRRDRNCYVYSLKNGRLLKCTLSGLRNWDGLDCDMKNSVWVDPVVFLPN